MPTEFPCSSCGKKADYIDTETYEDFYCEDCAEKQDEDYLLPIVNSPRMGVCAYCGDEGFDNWTPKKSN